LVQPLFGETHTRCRHAFQRERGRRRAPRPAAFRRVTSDEPASGTRPTDNGPASAAQVELGAEALLGTVIHHRLAPRFGAHIGGFAVDVIEYALAYRAIVQQ
jgi:hypothetical protein